MRVNKTKAKLLAGGNVFGINIDVEHPDMVQILGHMGFDFAVMDCEHGELTEATIGPCITAAYATDITPMAMIPNINDNVIMRYLEQAPQGLHVPHIDTKEEAQAVVDAAYYPPKGKRWFGGRKNHEWNINQSREESQVETNRELLIAAQIESVKAIENIPEIATVEGIDILYFGPGDLAQDMGISVNEIWHPKTLAMIERGITEILKAGKIPGTPSSSEEMTKRMLGLGCRYIYNHCLSLIIPRLKSYLETVKKY